MFAARETKRTIVLVSTSGGSGGDAGAQAAADLAAAGCTGPFDAAIVLGDLAGASAAQAVRRALLRRLRLGAAAAAAHRRRRDHARGRARPGRAERARPARPPRVPARRRRTGRARRRGAAGGARAGSAANAARPPASASSARTPGRARARRCSARSTRSTAPDVPPALQTGVVLQRKTMPAWALRLLLGTLLLPPLVVVADGLARLRRRRVPVGALDAVDAQLRAAVPVLRAVRAACSARLGIIGAAPSAPVPAGRAAVRRARRSRRVVAVALAFVLAWLLLGALAAPARARARVRPDGEVAGLPLVLLLARRSPASCGSATPTPRCCWSARCTCGC